MSRSTLRDRTLVPWPHDTVQPDQGDQSDHKQAGTAAGEMATEITELSEGPEEEVERVRFLLTQVIVSGPRKKLLGQVHT